MCKGVEIEQGSRTRGPRAAFGTSDVFVQVKIKQEGSQTRGPHLARKHD